MTATVLRRAAELLLVLLGLSVLVFLLTSLAPGDPAEEILRRGGIQPTARSVAALRAELGLDQPLFTQYLRWLLALLRGDFGHSYTDRSPVAAEILSRVPATLRLAGAAAAVAVVLAVLASVRAAFRPGALDSRAIALVTVAIAGVPPYIVGILLISVVAVGLRALPTGGADGPGAVVLPALTLGLAGAATLLRLLRADLARALRLPFVRLAAAKGLRPRRAIMVHALRVAAPNAITAASTVLAELLAGAVVVETLFSWPGVGQLAVSAIRQRDLPVVQAYVLVTAVTTVLVLALVELCLAAADPRVRRR
ncbi:ABC transporter permease [Nonomuraea angiospora]|uniref:ABC transporter permease n=1 Tax=Nonomuraea angiospora TaxID=46172 RepID=UPI0029AB5AD5|nr:ABC transporter permease [Nonomuraea angiospora]MDX3100174.1 ABC transporter permease [Nonomuraea angiospora]